MFSFSHVRNSKFLKGKNPDCTTATGALITFLQACQRRLHDAFFSHPDYTVGTGISPVRLPKQFTDYTVGRESMNFSYHPAPKNSYLFLLLHCMHIKVICQHKINFFNFFIFSSAIRLPTFITFSVPLSSKGNLHKDSP